MPFSSRVVTRALLRARYICEGCGKSVYWQVGEPPKAELHSFSTLHLDLDRIDQSKYIVTSPPPNHEVLRGKRLPITAFNLHGRPDDAFCLCFDCHDEVHRLADMRCLVSGSNAVPSLLQEVTLVFVKLKYGRYLTPR